MRATMRRDGVTMLGLIADLIGREVPQASKRWN
jgi:hypothetical protein